MTFGTKLRKHREKKRLSQKEVAEQIGVSQTTYHNWETDISSFRVEFLSKLAQVFEVAIIELMPDGATVKVTNNQHQKNHDTAIVGFEANMAGSHDLYADLLRSKDEIIHLLKEENAQLKDRNALLEEERKQIAL